MRIIKNLKEHRSEKQLLQKEVAMKSNISKSFYSLIESGHRNCSIHTANKICEVLNLDLNEFYNLLKKINTIRLALKTFESLDMIVMINDTITIPNWSKHQSLDKMRSRSEYMKVYMQKYRKEQALLALGEKPVNKPVNKKVNSKPNSKPKVNTLEEELELDKKIYREVIDYLNMKVDKNFTHTSKATQRLINARINEKYTLEDFKTVIDIKSDSWKNDPNMSSYLRPNTLFGTKFEGYLNERPKENANTNTTEYGW